MSKRTKRKSRHNSVNVLRKKQKEHLPLAIKELSKFSKKTSHWIWWAFPTDKKGKSEPSPKTSLTKQNAKRFLKDPL